MPDGSIHSKLATLEGTASGVSTLLGAAPEGATPATGLAGAAALLDTPPADLVDAVAQALGEQLPDVLRFDAATALGPATTLFAELQQAAKRPPEGAITSFGERLEAAGSAIAGDLVDEIGAALDAVRSISTGIPADPAAVVGTLVDQLLGVTGALEGPEADMIRAWARTLQELLRELTPILEQAVAAPDAGAFAVAVIERSLEATLDTLGFPRAARLVRLLAHFPADAVEPALATAVLDAFDELSAALAKVADAKAAPFPELRDRVAEAGEALAAARRALRSLLRTVRQVRHAKILQPGALEAELRALLAQAASVRIDDVAKVADPFEALMDRLDEAVAAIDLDPVREDVLGFFKDLRTTIETADLGGLGDALDDALAPAGEAVADLRDGLAEAQAKLTAFVDELASGVRQAGGAVGTFRPDGTFEFAFEPQLRELLATAHVALAGDPADPAAPSFAGELEALKTSLDGLFKELGKVLGEVALAVTTAVGEAKAGLQAFADYVTGLKLGEASETLRGEVQKIVDALEDIDFDAVVDEVVGVLDDNTEKLRAIDPPDMNELLRSALKAVLGAFLTFDFVGEITEPIRTELATVAKLPAQAVEDLQRRWEGVVARLDQLHPERLLDPLFAALETVEDAIAGVKLTPLLAPLDELHQEHLQAPFARLEPKALLAPASRTFREYTGALERLNGADLVAPLTRELGKLQEQVGGVDLDAPLGALLTAVETAQRELEAAKPSELLKPLTAEVDRLLTALDALKPSVLLAPATALAGPLITRLETIQQSALDALSELFAGPRAVLEQLEPVALERALQDGLDAVATAIRAAQVRARFDDLKAAHFDLAQALSGDPRRADLVALLDPETQLGPLVAAHDELLRDLAELRDGVALPDLAGLYDELSERLLGLLPPYANPMNPDGFKAFMRLADPTRFALELDERFAALRAKLLPVAPEELAAELDATWASAVAVVGGIDLEQPVETAKQIVTELKAVVTGLRVDFLATDVDRALTDLRAVVAALDPQRAAEALAPLHADLAGVLAATLPSTVLAALATELDNVTAKLSTLDLGTSLKQPLDTAWLAIDAGLHALDFQIVLAPITDRLEELALELKAGLDETEDHFVAMVAAGRAAL